ncbi:glycosyltransferase family 4 protein [Patescibacteria group bacterium]
MKILYIINGLGFSQNTGIGGSDKRAVEVIRNTKLLDKKGSYDILTTISGYNIFTNDERLNTKYHVIDIPTIWPNAFKKNLFGRVLSYFFSTIKSLIWYKKFSEYDAFFATSDFFFDILPAYFFKLIHKKKMICMVHHFIESPSKRDGSLLINYLLYFSQKLSFWFIKITADIIFVYETPEGEKIKENFFSNQISKVYKVKNGIDNTLIDKSPRSDKTYEACFLGGLRYSKGIKEFVPIWKKIIKNHPNAKFVIIGGGSKELVKELDREITNNNLGKNIILRGPLSGTNLYETIKMCKVFLFPSHEEGWGIALCEAMYCGLPVVCYNLPAYEIFGDRLKKVPKGSHDRLAKHVLEYLNSPKLIENDGLFLKNVAKNFTWKSIAQEELKLFRKLII